MIEFAEPRVIRIATENDIEPLEKNVPKGDVKLHARRYELQKSGDATYLVAVQGEVPIGHALIKWKGATDEPVAENLADPTPDIEDLFVHEGHRNRRVGSRLLEMAERLARERGYKQIGLACGADNTQARALYDARGYLDSGIPPYTLSGKYKDADGAEQEWTERDCAYLLLPLHTAAAATEMNMENNNTNTTEETPEQTTLSENVTPTETVTPPATPEKPVSEQVVDFAFGVALTAAEALEKAVRVAQAEGPAVWEALQEKGRPARQKLVQSLREETREETEAVAQNKADVATGGDTEVTGNTPPDEPRPPIKPAPRPFGFGRLGGVSAEDEIKALEDRVKSLERDVVRPGETGNGQSEATMLSEESVNPREQTAAETGTALVDFTPETTEGDALVNSPYAITDEEERAAVPSQTGSFVSSSGSESSPGVVSTTTAEGEEADESYVADDEPSLSPPKGKRSKKTTSDASAGTNPDDDGGAMTVEELEA